MVNTPTLRQTCVMSPEHVIRVLEMIESQQEFSTVVLKIGNDGEVSAQIATALLRDDEVLVTFDIPSDVNTVNFYREFSRALNIQEYGRKSKERGI